MARHLIATIPQVDGGIRELYAPTERAAIDAKEAIRRDSTMIDHLGSLVSEVVDIAKDGTRTRVR